MILIMKFNTYQKYETQNNTQYNETQNNVSIDINTDV